MSATWNGKPLLALRADSPASRCMDILERGMARMGLSSAPAQFNKILPAAPRAGGKYTAPRSAAWVDTMVLAWKALPAGKRNVRAHAEEWGMSQANMWKILHRRGLVLSLRERTAARYEELVGRWLGLPPAERDLDLFAEANGVRRQSLRELLQARGLFPRRRRRVA